MAGQQAAARTQIPARNGPHPSGLGAKARAELVSQVARCRNPTPATGGTFLSRIVHSSDRRQTERRQCCTADTPPRSLSNVSRSRPTTDQPRCFVAARLMLILRKGSAKRWPRRTSPTPLRAPGPAATSTDSLAPLLRTGPDVETRPKSPSGGIRAKEIKVACGMYSPRKTARGRYYAWPIRHSEDRKVALNRNYCRTVTIETLGRIRPRLERTYSTSRFAPAAPRCWRDCGL
jgi:hypothetical protein